MISERRRRYPSQGVLSTENSSASIKSDGGTPPVTSAEVPPPPVGSSPSLSGKQPPSTRVTRKNSTLRNNIIATIRIKAAIDAAKSAESQFEFDEIRIGLKKYMSNSLLGKIYENFIIFIGIFAAVEYIHSTYALNKHNAYQNQRPVLDSLDIFFAAIFAFDWLLNYFLADSKVYYFWSFFSWVDILILISTFGTRSESIPYLDNVNTFYIGMLYSFFVIRPVVILRSLRVYVKFMNIIDAVDRYLAQIVLFAGVFILFFAAIMQQLEKHSRPLPFHSWMYFIFVTTATVGYGDIVPRTAASRVATMGVILFAVISVPIITNELIEKMKLQSVFMRAIYTPKTRNARHIVVCGDLSSTNLNDLFLELFHEDHENNDLHAVILLPRSPSVELILLMQSNEFCDSLTYLEGSALNDHDLRRARAEIASAIFIMTNKFSSNPDEEDAKSILINLSIKRYISSFYRAKMLYCLQLLRPENKRHLTKTRTNEIDPFDLVVCLNEIKMGAMAQAVICPGANTLLMNLLTSFSDDNIEVDESELENAEVPGQISNKEGGAGTTASDKQSKVVEASPKAWFDEYQKGCGWEIYVTRLSKAFTGMKFTDLSYALYDRKGIVLFGLQLTDKRVVGAQRMMLNPGPYVIPSSEFYEVEAFVIAKNKASSDLSGEAAVSIHAQSNLIGNITFAAANMIKSSVASRDNSIISERRKSSLRDVDRLRSTIAAKGGRPGDPSIMEEDDEDDEDDPKNQNVKKESKWKKLKRSALLERKIKVDSFQEVIHRLEDEHFNDNYYVRPTPLLDINEITVKTNVVSEIPYINHHIIILGKGLRNLFDLIRPLRSKHLGPMRLIVILYPYEFPIDVWRRISIFDGLIFVRGSPLEDSNLRRAGIFRADTVVVLTEGVSNNPNSNNNNNTDGSEHHPHKGGNVEALVDSDAIFSYQHVRRLNPHTQIVVEIVNQSNISYLGDPTNPPLVDDPKFSPQFAAGNLFTTGLLDAIVCQAYYNPDVIKVVNRLLTGIDQVERTQLVLSAAEELGHVPKDLDSSSDSSDSDIDLSEEAIDRGRRKTLKKEQSRQQLPKEIQLHKARKKLLKIPNSCLYQISIPDIGNSAKKDYGAVYQHLAGQGIIPIGVLRGTLANLRVGPKANQLPYVFTNPPKDTELFSCDRLFVLATTPQKLNQKLEVKDWLLNLQMQQKIRANNPTTPTSGKGSGINGSGLNNSSSMAGSLFLGSGLKFTLSDDAYAVLDITEKNYKKLDEKMKKITHDVEEKLSTVIGSLESLLANDFNHAPAEPMDYWSIAHSSRSRFTSVADEMSVGSGESRSRRSPIEAVMGSNSHAAGIIKQLSVRTEVSATSVTASVNSMEVEYQNSGRTSRSHSMTSADQTYKPSSPINFKKSSPPHYKQSSLPSPHHIISSNEEKDNDGKKDDDDDDDEKDSPSKSGLLISAVSFPRKYSHSKRRPSNNVAPIQEEADSNPSTNHSEDENVNNEAVVLPSPKFESKLEDGLTSPSNRSRAASAAIFPITSSPTIEKPSLPPLPTRSRSSSAAVSARLDHAISNISDVTAQTNEDRETTELIELIDNSNPTTGRGTMTTGTGTTTLALNSFRRMSSNSTVVMMSSRVESPTNLMFTLSEEENSIKDDVTIEEEELKNLEKNKSNNNRPNKAPTTQNFMNQNDKNSKNNNNNNKNTNNQSIPRENQTISHYNISSNHSYANNNDDNNSVRSFTSMNSSKTVDKIPGPKITDITPLPLDRIPRFSYFQSPPPQLQIPLQQQPQSYQYPILGGMPSSNSNSNLNYSPGGTGDYIPSLQSPPILNGGSRSLSSRSDQQVLQASPVTRNKPKSEISPSPEPKQQPPPHH